MRINPDNENWIPLTLRDCEPRKKMHHDRMLSAFWEELLFNGGPLSNEEISIKLFNYQLELDMTVPYMIVLFSVKYRKELTLRNDENLVRCIFRWRNTGYFRVSMDISGIVVPVEREMTTAGIIEQCEEYTRFLKDVWKYRMAVFTGIPLYMDKLTGHFNELLAMEQASVAEKLYKYEELAEKQLPGPPPNMELWRLMLEKELYDQLYEAIKAYMAREMPVLHRHYLNRFMHGFEQMIYHFSAEKDMHLTMLMDELEEMIYVHRYDSVENALVYIKSTFEKIRQKRRGCMDSVSVSERVKEYVARHLDQDLPRETLAACVHMNADYLGKVFKKENGISLKEYVTREKLQMACELLGKTKLPVSEVALRVGYRNFAHFSTAFRRFTGFSPVAFRQTEMGERESK